VNFLKVTLFECWLLTTNPSSFDKFNTSFILLWQKKWNIIWRHLVLTFNKSTITLWQKKWSIIEHINFLRIKYFLLMKDLLIDLYPIIIKQLWDTKMLKIMVQLVIRYNFLFLLLWTFKGAIWFVSSTNMFKWSLTHSYWTPLDLELYLATNKILKIKKGRCRVQTRNGTLSINKWLARLQNLYNSNSNIHTKILEQLPTTS
jgi:hypothetical protein